MGVLAMVRMVAIFSSGVTAGILFGDRMGATFARPSLSPSSFLQSARSLCADDATVDVSCHRRCPGLADHGARTAEQFPVLTCGRGDGSDGSGSRTHLPSEHSY